MVNDGWHECLAPEDAVQAPRRRARARRGGAVGVSSQGGAVNRLEAPGSGLQCRLVLKAVTRPGPGARSREPDRRWNPFSPSSSASPGSYTLDFYAAAPGLRGAPQGPGDDARRAHRRGQEVRAPRPRRRRVPDGHEVAVRGQEVSEAALHLLQRRRERAGHVQGPPADGAQPPPAHRGVRDRLPRDRRQGRLHLHPRRVPPRPAHPRGGDCRGVRQGLPRKEHLRHRVRLRRVRAPRRRRVRGGRGDGAHRIARGQACAAPPEAAVPRGRRPLRLPDRRQQRRDALQRAPDRHERRGLVPRARAGEERRARSCSA